MVRPACFIALAFGQFSASASLPRWPPANNLPGNNHSAVQVVGTGRPHLEAGGGKDPGCPPGLNLAGFNEQPTTVFQPGGRFGRYLPVEIQPVGTTVQRNPGFVIARFRGHGAKGVRGNVRRINRQHPDPAPECGRKGIKKVALMNLPANPGNVLRSTRNGNWINVSGMQPDGNSTTNRCHGSRNGNAYRTGTATEVHYNGWQAGVVRPSGSGNTGKAQRGHSFPHQQPRPEPRNKHSRVNGNPQAAKPGPAKNVFQGNT